MECGYEAECKEVIKVVGVGGGATKAVNNMIDYGLEDVEFIVVDIDAPTFRASQAQNRVQLCGKQQIKSAGIGGELENGRNLALMSTDQLSEHLTGADLVFIVVGMGGKTGSGAALVIAQLAKKAGALVVGVATKPFNFEGSRRKLIAEFGLGQLLEHVDSLITISSDSLLNNELEKTIKSEAFRKVDDTMLLAVQCISGFIITHGPMGVDFQDIKTIMENTGKAVMGTGIGRGRSRCVEATQQVISNLLIEDRGAMNACGLLLLYTVANENCMPSVEELSDVYELVFAEIREDCDSAFWTMYDESLEDKFKVTAIAVNFDSDWPNQHLEVGSTVEDIIRTVAEYYEISTKDLLLKNKNTLLPRQIAMYLARNITGESYAELGNKFGRDHAVIMFACNKIEAEIAFDDELLLVVKMLKKIKCRNLLRITNTGR